MTSPALPPVPHDPLAQDLERFHTYQEFAAQPAIWQQWGAVLADKVTALHIWLDARNHSDVYFCGAGTSAYIGETLAHALGRQTHRCRYTALPTTDLVSQPRDYLQSCGPRALFVSFGRSGNSPESIGTLDALDQLAPQADRLHIYCNPDGALARRTAPGPGQLMLMALPSQTHDKGFAMTSSYSTMLLTGLALLDRAPGLAIAHRFHHLAQAGAELCGALARSTATLRRQLPQRIVFIGSGMLAGVARESALKVLELTAGHIATLSETALGFRHGPKSFTTAQTQLVMLISADPVTQRYELDLRTELQSQFGKDRVFSLGPASAGCDLTIPTMVGPAWSAVLYVLLAQYLAMCWSRTLDFNVDNPFENGHLTRVVQGVRLYPVQLD